MGTTLNPRVLEIEPSGIRKVYNQLVNFPDAINLTVGEPDFSTPDHIKEAAIDSLRANHTGYSVNTGLLSLRQEVQSFFADRYDVHYRAEDEIIITNGASEALDIAFRTILEEGDEVIVFAPAYPGYVPLITLSGGVPVLIDTSENGFKPTLEQLKKAVNAKTKAILFNYPSNPTGAVLSGEEVRNLTEWLKDQNLFVLSDEIYSENTFDGTHVSIASMEGMRDKTILIQGLSKSHSMTGWRIGYTLAPAFLSKQMEKVHLFNVVCAPITSQYAAIAALKNGRNDSEPMNIEYMKRRDFVYRRLNEIGLETEKPKGAFYIFPKIPSSFPDSSTFSEALLREGRVAVVPGSAFSSYGEGFIRISYAYSMETLEEALHRIEAFLKNTSTE
ncbi:aminotransferase class I/II-fold pyridoxal phosphate-dependent enzyme [Sporosarcina sp. PTS2304]|uniref:aminotransferase class I/II-fold pyridoxal phosphate-dependent enzyme n=1 Tax=Sporosarcina sp. PTS2304 TaxID=2283194 RepID=UPI000E0DCC92|nr:aminotransferase class I/II-fold pyridoxal phosphate-dependent enzyme [Sporosarcina sp. PTS2304]AXI01347.1 aminotransferase class I/II-fold pyridoxal phosphate-dependent enzyme [Sporosarcina sp. PTS2304]